MALYASETRPDGTTIVLDDADGFQAVLKAGQWEQIAHLPDSERRHRTEQFLIANRRSGDPRTRAEQEAMQANEQGQGERHQEGER